MTRIVKYATINSFLTALYVVLVALFISSLSSGFDEVDSLIVPIAMLMLLVFSVAFVGSLIFGRPILWYIEGKKKDAVKLLICTLGIFFLITIVAFLFLIVFGFR